MAELRFDLAGKPVRSDKPLDVRNPCDGSTVGRTWLAGDTEFDAAANAAVAAAPAIASLAARVLGTQLRK